MAKNDELREFLRTRRARLQPEDVGIETAGQRRVPGLRREEVAMLAGVSVDYYVRLEQGRDLQPSDSVLDAVARALRLAPAEREYLHNLVRAAAPSTSPEQPYPVRPPVPAGVRAILDTLGVPGVLVDFRGDVLATNRLARALVADFDAMPEAERNHSRWLFLDPAARERFVDWEMVARGSIAVIRDAAGRYPHDAALHARIGELSVASREFRTWWAMHDVGSRRNGTKRFRHPVVGELEVQYQALKVDGMEAWIYAHDVEPGSRSEEALRLLATWAATEDAEAARADQIRRTPRAPARRLAD